MSRPTHSQSPISHHVTEEPHNVPDHRRRTLRTSTCAAAALVLTAALLALAPAAGAAGPHPGLEVVPSFFPTDLAPGSTGYLLLRIYNTGAAESAGGSEAATLTDTLPAGLEVAAEEPLPGGCSAAGTGVVICTLAPIPPSPGLALFPQAYPVNLYVPVHVKDPLPADPGDTNVVEVSGGGALETARATLPVHYGEGPAPLGFADFDGWITGEEGTADTQAGSHPYELTMAFTTNTIDASGYERPSGGEAQALEVDLPPGLIGDPTAVPECRRENLDAEGECPADTAVGEDYPVVGGIAVVGFSVYNMVPPPGVAAEFAFSFDGTNTYLDARPRADGGYALSEHANLPQFKVGLNSLTIWGVPGEHNGSGEDKPLLRMPTYCPRDAEHNPIPPTFSQQMLGTWQEPETTDGPTASFTLHDAEGTPVGIDGCNQVPFEPTIEARPTTDVADSPTGFNFDLRMPQPAEAEGIGEADLRDAVVTLPEGLVVDPSSANGLTACTPAQIGLLTPVGQTPAEFDEEDPHCPEASRIGTVRVKTPLVDHELGGSIYLASQGRNPFGSLLALYAVIEDPASGTLIKLPALVQADPTTGRLTTTLAGNPQLPFEEFHFDFTEGAHASLKTSAVCGGYEVTSDLTPWTSPEGADAHPSSAFRTSQAPGGGSCPGSEGGAPDQPSFQAGTVTPTAGAYSPFEFEITRPDGSQRLSRIEATLPEGLLGKLAGIPYCPQADIAQAESRSHPGEGALEQVHPSCPAASEVGTVDVGAGAGPSPYYTSGQVYLAGPYEGAPLSLAIVTPAVAGPLDLGTVVVRTALQVDPLTTRITAVSDPLPRILQGIPLDIRSVAVKMSRPDFTLNPTSCDPTAITGSLTSAAGGIAPVSDPFQVGGCKSLGFKPRLKISLSGQTHRAGHPGLKAVLTYPQKGSYANIARAQVGLPHSEFLDQGNLDNVCTQPQLKAQSCPASSVYGHARAWSPLLEAPLEGPVYLAVGFGYKLPALVAELDGRLRVLLVGRVDTDKAKGIRNTFEAVPDAPVSRFELTLKGGKRYGLLENSEDICRATQKASAAFTAQDGASLTLHPTISARCGKGRKRHHGKHRHTPGSSGS